MPAIWMLSAAPLKDLHPVGLERLEIIVYEASPANPH